MSLGDSGGYEDFPLHALMPNTHRRRRRDATVESRRKKLRLAYLFKLVEGTVPAICTENYLTPQRPKRAVRLKSLSDHITNNSRLIICKLHVYAFSVEDCGQIVAFDSSNESSRGPLWWQY